MTDLEILALDALDRAERKLREIAAAEPTRGGRWLRLIEAVRDDAFVDFQDLIGGDLPFDAFWDDGEQGAVDQPLGPGGGPPWWPVLIYNKQPHSFWQGKYPFGDTPKKSRKRKRLAWTSKPPMYTSGPEDRPSPAKIAASPTRGVKPTEPLFVGVSDYNRKRMAEAIQRDDREVEELLLLGAL
jgi:hypothetical protein